MPGARLTVEQRRTIERCYRIGLSQGQIASIIGKDKAKVSRELQRSFSAPGSRSPKARTARGEGAGHWEGDLLLEATSTGAVITLVERSINTVVQAPLSGRHTAELARMSLAEMIATLPLSLRKSITWDRGSEMAHYAQFKTDTDLQIYFCDPQSQTCDQ